MIYDHVPTKDQIAGQRAYFMEVLRADPTIDGVITPDKVSTIRYMVAGNLFMRFAKTLADKQGRWVSHYLATPEQAQQLLIERVALDTTGGLIPGKARVERVTELTVGLNEADLVAITDRAKRGIDARWRAVHWTANHLGTPEIFDDGVGWSVRMVGGID